MYSAEQEYEDPSVTWMIEEEKRKAAQKKAEEKEAREREKKDKDKKQ